MKCRALWSRLDLLGVDQPTLQALERKGKLDSGRASRASLAPKIPFPFPFERLPRSLTVVNRKKVLSISNQDGV